MEDGTRPMSLKTFRLKTFKCQTNIKEDTDIRNKRASRRNSTEAAAPSRPKWGHRAQIPDMKVRLNRKLGHMPVSDKHVNAAPPKKISIDLARWMCSICKVALCLSESRHCFITYHNVNQA